MPPSHDLADVLPPCEQAAAGRVRPRAPSDVLSAVTGCPGADAGLTDHPKTKTFQLARPVPGWNVPICHSYL